MTMTATNSLRTYVVQVRGNDRRWTTFIQDCAREDAARWCANAWMADQMYREYRVISYPLMGERTNLTLRIEDL